MKYWIVKGQPKRNRFEKRLVLNRSDTWETKKPRKDWAKGDRLFFWESSPSQKIVGLGVFKEAFREEDDEYTLFNVVYKSKKFDIPISKSLLQEYIDSDPAYFRKVAGTVFSVTLKDAKIIYSLILKYNSQENIWKDLLIDIDSIPHTDNKLLSPNSLFENTSNKLITEFSEISDIEGIMTETIKYSRGRSDKLRKMALQEAKGVCAVCDTNFSKILNGKGVRVLQVHHLKQLASYDTPKITKLSDLAVVCANCHSLIHMNPKEALGIEKLKWMLSK